MRWLACFVMVGLTACSGSVESNGAGGAAGTEGGGGSPGATSSAHGSGSTSTAVATTSSGSSSSSSSGTSASGTGGAGAGGSSGVGGGVDCGGFVTMTVDNGGPEHLGFVCPDGHAEFETSEPAGYLLHGEGAGRTILGGCSASGGAGEAITLSIVGDAMVGDFGDGAATYTDAAGAKWDQPIGYSVAFTNVEDSGGVIEGTFKVQVSRGGSAAHQLDGSFRVCHVQDVFLP